MVVPVNASNPERTGFIIEAIAEESKNYLSAPYYDTVLNGKELASVIASSKSALENAIKKTTEAIG